jgi:hypothetical protein
MNFRKKFVVKPGAKFRLGDIDPAYKGEHESHLHATPQASHSYNTNSTPKTSVRLFPVRFAHQVRSVDARGHRG